MNGEQKIAPLQGSIFYFMKWEGSFIETRGASDFAIRI